MIVVMTSCAPTVRLEEPGDPGEHRAGQHAAEHEREDDVSERRAGRRRATIPIQTATIDADEVLALAADVEEAAAEGERDREPREDERDRQRMSVCWRFAATTSRCVPGNQTSRR